MAQPIDVGVVGEVFQVEQYARGYGWEPLVEVYYDRDVAERGIEQLRSLGGDVGASEDEGAPGPRVRRDARGANARVGASVLACGG